MRDIMRQKLADALVFDPPELTLRDVQLPTVPRRAAPTPLRGCVARAKRISCINACASGWRRVRRARR